MRSLVFVGDRCCDHSPSSGYDQLCTIFPDSGWLSGRLLTAGNVAWIRPSATINDGLDCDPGPVFHVLYGDCSGSALPAILRDRWPRATIVSTVHQPIDRLVDSNSLRCLDGVDAIVTVCQEQASQLAGLGLTASLHAVPHGVWTKVFRPPPGHRTRSDRNEILIVGTYLRDWQFARRVIGRIAQVGIRSRVLGASAKEQLAIDHPLVTVSPQVSEPELVQLYHRSVALFLPVLGATASNALLEAMTAGCPVVCTRFPSFVEEYVGDDSDAFAPQDEDRAVDLLVKYATNLTYRNTRSRTLMRRAQMFDWARLRVRFMKTYKAIASSVGPT